MTHHEAHDGGERRERLAVNQTEAAEMLGVSTITLRRWAQAGRIRFTRPAGGRGQKMVAVSSLKKLVGA